MWKVEAQKLLWLLIGHTLPVNAVASSPYGRHIVSGSNDTTVRLWHAETGKLLGIVKEHTGHVHSVAFSSDSKRVVSGSADSTVRVWDTISEEGYSDPAASSPNSTSEVHQYIGHSGGENDEIGAVATFSPDGRYIISSGEYNTVCLWDSQIGKRLHMLEGHAESICRDGQ